jgi:acyl-CoA reductase-like NAD-dependent aldehyde dehydrogenase
MTTALEPDLAVAGAAARNITPALLELGGKNAMIVFDDADFDRAVQDAAEGGFYNKGEACTATSRILVQDGHYRQRERVRPDLGDLHRRLGPRLPRGAPHRGRMVFINNYFRGTGGTPFGGTKHSGYGREHAIETLREYSYTKIVRFPSGLGTVPAWRALDDIFEEPGRP